MFYIVSFFALALFPFALAAYGGHLAAKVLDGKKRRTAFVIVWAPRGPKGGASDCLRQEICRRRSSLASNHRCEATYLSSSIIRKNTWIRKFSMQVV